MPKPGYVLLVDDNRIATDVISAYISEHIPEAVVVCYHNIEEGFDEFKHRWEVYDVIILDLWFGGEPKGIEFLKRVRNIDPAMHVVILTGRPTEAIEMQARILGVSNFLVKPYNLDDLAEIITKIIYPGD